MAKTVFTFGSLVSISFLAFSLVVLTGCADLIPAAKEIHYVTQSTPPTSNPAASPAAQNNLDEVRQIVQSVGNNVPYGNLALAVVTLITGLITGGAGGVVVANKNGDKAEGSRADMQAALTEVVSDVGGWIQGNKPFSPKTTAVLTAAGLHDAATPGVQPVATFVTTVKATNATPHA